MRSAFKIILGLLLFLLLALFVAFITGRSPRSYTSLAPDEQVLINNQLLPVQEAAKIYQPQMFIKESTPSPDLLWVWYEVVPTESTLDFVYYYTWENEVNPNQTLHGLYSIFRAAYFGYPLYDIEYFQINVDRKSGEIAKIKVETSIHDDFNQEIVEHIVLEAFPENSPTFLITKSRLNGEVLEQEKTRLFFNEKRILAGVLTWNHLSCLLNPSDQDEYSILVDAELKYLSDKEYSNYKFSRKSQGDHKSHQNYFFLSFLLIVAFIFAFSLVFFFDKLRRKQNG